MNTSFIPYDIRFKQWDMEKKIKEELKDPNFLNMYTRKTLREVMVTLFPYETMMNRAGRAFCGMTKARMYRHLLGYAILKDGCANLNESLMENIIEITQKYTCMVLNKVITMPEDHYDVNNAIIRIAKEFEEKYPYETSWDGELDYIEEIEKYAEKRLFEEFGE